MFEIINNTNKEIKELDKLEKYMNSDDTLDVLIQA